MPVDNVSDFECSESFTISFGVAVACTISLDAVDAVPINVPRSQNSINFTKIFLYTIGPGPDADSDHYGFSYSLSGTGVSAITVASHSFQPTVPHLDPDVPEPKVGSFEATMSVNRQVAEVTFGHLNSLDITVRLIMNTGVGG